MLEILIKIACVVGVSLLMVAYMILAERKIAGWIQDRIGPNRAGPRGIVQPLCDGLKLLFKEDFTPDHVHKFLFIVAPCIMMGFALSAIAVIPFGGQIGEGDEAIHLQIARVDIGILFVIAVSSLSVYGVFLGGWASNNKYSLLGGIRGAAQMLSYEVPMALSILCIVMLSGTLRLERIVDLQMNGCWNIITQPFVFIIFLFCIFAETKRTPFDLAECEQELVGGFHTEYSSMKFGLYFLGEYAHMIVACSMAVVLFFGGWQPLPFVHIFESHTVGAAIMRVLVFLIKVWMFIAFYMWVRWTLPRFRFDQVMSLAWRAGVPLALALLLLNAIIMYFYRPDSEGGYGAGYYIWQIIANIGVFVALILVVGFSNPKLAVANVPIIIDKTEEAS
ncbi:MAG: NADH-quinone oxidoreductase subunit NuoH [Planctomycetes bacterium]|nr:NADH-quinone oxidoreductase subunit NuoH [Planctomycetota bacterium]